ncbi:MAG TPA: ABC transporter permease [Candidatus Eisenbacteria bacterium]|nr:ABC transporter permease [Candidatus Eisenbacteria bacterium]
MPPLAQRNLMHDKVRLAVTLTGIVFAVVLIVVEMGLFLGFTVTTSSIIDKSNVDLWIVSQHTPYIEQGAAFSERKLYQVLATPGVASAERYIVRFAQWKTPNGSEQSVQVVGFNPYTGVGGPWNVVQGDVNDLKTPDAVMVDELYAKKLGVTRMGEVFEIDGRRARVVGFTRGIRAFTTTPYVFTSFKNAQGYARLQEDQTLFILVRAVPDADLKALQQSLNSRLRDVDVLTAAKFSSMTRIYWMFTTGAGVAVLIAALLGLVVGVVVVAQTIYATTMDHIREYGTLKAMGAPNSYIYKVIITQAGIAAVVGYGLAMFVSFFVVRASQTGGAAILLPLPMAVGIFFLTLLMCVTAAVVSINKVTSLDPAMVFRG